MFHYFNQVIFFSKFRENSLKLCFGFRFLKNYIYLGVKVMHERPCPKISIVTPLDQKVWCKRSITGEVWGIVLLQEITCKKDPIFQSIKVHRK